MENWTEEQLREAVSKKGNLKATTDIVCKHFLEAIEDQKYGYFWCVHSFSLSLSLSLWSLLT